MNEKHRKPPETEEEVFDTFLDLFDAIAPETPEEINEFLRERGYDPEELTKRAKDIFKEGLEKSPLDWRNRARQEIENTKTKIAQQKPKSERSRKEIVAAITSIQEKQGSAIAAHFRNLNLDKVSDEELADMLDELEYLESENTELDE